MSLQLYFGPGACSFVPHVLLEASGVAYEPIMVKLHKQEHLAEAFRAINPLAQVPVLVEGGQTITQIIAICCHLDALLPEQQFLPREPRARTRVLETLAWMNGTVHPTFAHMFMPFKFTDNPAIHGDLKRHAQAAYRGHLAKLEELVVAKNTRGEAFLGGAHLGPLDPYAMTLFRWGGMSGIDPAACPALGAYLQRLAELPAVARAMARERITLATYQPT